MDVIKEILTLYSGFAVERLAAAITSRLRGNSC